MAWADGGACLTVADTTAGTSITGTMSQTVAVGEVIVLWVSKDNANTTDGDHSEITSVVDSQSNVWTKAGEHTNGQGAANAGATESAWVCVVTTQLTSGVDTIAAGFSDSRTASTMQARRLTVGAGASVTVVAVAGLSNDAADPGSIALSGLASQEYWFGRFIATESNTLTAITPTASWTTLGQQVANTGTSATSMMSRGEFRILTGTGATSDPTLFAADHASVMVALREDQPLSIDVGPLALGAAFPSPSIDGAMSGSALALAPVFPSSSFVLAPALSALALAPVFPTGRLDLTTSASALALAPVFPTTSLALGLSGSALGLAAVFPTPAVVAPAPPTSAWDLIFVLFDAAHDEQWPVWPIDGNIGHDPAMVGQASLTFPAGDEAPTIFMGATLGQEFPEVSCRAYCRGRRIWTGKSVTVRMVSQGAYGIVEVTFEHSYGHFLRRRQVFAASLAAIDQTDQADDAILIIQKAQIGLSPTIPTGHPGTRTNFGSSTVTVHTGSGLAPSTRILEQSGNNLLDVTVDAIDTHDLAPIMLDQENGTYVLNMTYPFEEEDVTATVIFSQWHGNLSTFEFVSDRLQLANIAAVEGKTAKDAEWDDDPASITLWGETELFAQKPQDADDVNAKVVEAASLIGRQGSAKLTYKAEIIETDGHRFVTNWFWRSRIKIVEAIWNIEVEGAVKTWAMQVANSRMYKLDVVLGEPRVGDIFRHVAGFTGLPGPRLAGNKWRNRRQS